MSSGMDENGSDDHELIDIEDCCTEGKKVGKAAENYLSKVEEQLLCCHNPRLKNEQRKLLDLLESYKKLCATVQKQELLKKSYRGYVAKIPEIYTILHPDIYRDEREEEKERLRQRLQRRTPSRERSRDILGTKSTPTLFDLRQQEKERFAQLLEKASHSGRQEQSPGHPSIALPRPIDRDKEKDRLARIFSSDLDANPSFKKKASKPSPKSGTQSKTNPTPPGKKSKKETASAALAKTKQEISLRPTKERALNGSRLQAGNKPRTTFAANPQERKKKILDQRNKEYSEYNSKMEGAIERVDCGVLAREDSILQEYKRSPNSVVSTSTQTDLSLLSDHPPRPTSLTQHTESQQEPTFPVTKESLLHSPRAKLIKDLHCVSPCLPGVSPLLILPDEDENDEKLRQQALYAEALSAQIAEKRRLEAERQQREAEESAQVERRALEQQKRLKQEFEREQSLRHRWLHQVQDDLLRQRLEEMEIEARELKKQLRNNPEVLSPRKVEELIPRTIQALAKSPRPSERVPANKRDKTESRPVRLDNEDSPRSGGQKESNFTESDQNDNSIPLRSVSPVLPALQTDTILRKNNLIPSRGNSQIEEKEDTGGDKILAQLGVFRRELELEQEKLKQRLTQQS